MEWCSSLRLHDQNVRILEKVQGLFRWGQLMFSVLQDPGHKLHSECDGWMVGDWEDTGKFQAQDHTSLSFFSTSTMSSCVQKFPAPPRPTFLYVVLSDIVFLWLLDVMNRSWPYQNSVNSS